MRLLICAGGTGGGVYPALAILQTIQQQEHADRPGELQAVEMDRPMHNQAEKLPPQASTLQTLWVGGQGGMENGLVQRAGVPFTAIPAAGLHGVGVRNLPGNLARLGRGLLAARRLIGEFRPQVMLLTGGYLAVPVALAARLTPWTKSRPVSLLYVPDVEPGLALKTLAQLADHITVTVEDTRNYLGLRANVTVTGYPVRPGLLSWNRAEARRALGLNPELPTLLVLGGSKGARSINRALLGVLPELLEAMQVVHLSGQLDWPEVETARNGLSESLARRYHPHPYLHEQMGAALRAADLAVSRAGASTLGEFPVFGLPAVLAPYPHAWRYQKVNAEYLVRRGAALMVEDALLQTQLLPVVRELIYDEHRRVRMRQAMAFLARPQAASEIAAIARSMANAQKKRRT